MLLGKKKMPWVVVDQLVRAHTHLMDDGPILDARTTLVEMAALGIERSWGAKVE